MNDVPLFIVMLAGLVIMIIILTQVTIVISPYISMWFGQYVRRWRFLRNLERESYEITQEERRGDYHLDKTPRDSGSIVSPDFVALIDAIRAQGRANLKEERREDRGKRKREIITIWLIALTFCAIVLQVREMIKVYGPVKDQADATIKQAASSEKALIESQRAWVGPQNASFDGEPTIGKSLEITITYNNSGREPALGFVSVMQPFNATSEDEGTTNAAIQEFVSECRTKKEWTGGSVIYPGTNTGFGSGYRFFAKTDNNFVTPNITKGNEIIVVEGCFSYRTFDVPRYSYFCYFFKQGLTKINNLSICTVGQDAN